MYALALALQLGFGLSIGSQLVTWHRDVSFVDGCDDSGELPDWALFLLMAPLSVAFNILLQARAAQWVALTAAAAVAYGTSYAAALCFDPAASSATAAFATGLL